MVIAQLLDSFYDKKARIVRRLNELKRNAQAFDDFLIFFEEAKKETNQYGFKFNNINQYTDISKRGVITEASFSNLQSNIRRQLNTLERNVHCFDEHMQFLKDMEKEFTQYDENNKTIKEAKERLQGKRGKIPTNQIYAQQQSIRNELSKLERRARAFDDFSEYYQKTNQKMRILYGKKLVNCDEYLDPENRVSFEPIVFSNKQRMIENAISNLSIERDKKIEQLREEIEKRNLNFYTYLAKRNTDRFSISMSDIKTILKSMELIDRINETLSLYGMDIKGFLKLQGKALIDMKYKELLVINDVISNYINSVENVNFADIDLINFEEDVPISTSKK